MNYFIGATYDAVTLFGMAINETLEAGDDLFDGLAVAKKMHSRTFYGMHTSNPTSCLGLFNFFYFIFAMICLFLICMLFAYLLFV